MGIFVNVSGTWRTVTAAVQNSYKAFVNVNGTWRNVSASYVNVGGTWRKAHQYTAYVVPNVVGLTVAAAQAAVTSSGNLNGTSTSSSTSNSAVNGQVATQSIAAGSYTTQQTVAITYYTYVAPIIATPVQLDTESSTSLTSYPGASVSVPVSGPQAITNIAVNGVNVAFSGTTFTAPTALGSYSIQVFDGAVPLLAPITLSVIAVPYYAPAPYYAPYYAPIVYYSFVQPYYASPPPSVGGGCWAVGTPVTMADGTKKLIEDLVVGDELMTADIPTYPNGEDSSLWYPASTWSTDRIDNITKRSTTVTYANMFSEPYYYVTNDRYKLSWEHWMFIKRDDVWQFMQMSNVKVGDTFVDENNVEIPITSVVLVEEPIDVVLVDVEPNDLFYADGILTHNILPIKT